MESRPAQDLRAKLTKSQFIACATMEDVARRFSSERETLDKNDVGSDFLRNEPYEIVGKVVMGDDSRDALLKLRMTYNLTTRARDIIAALLPLLDLDNSEYCTNPDSEPEREEVIAFLAQFLSKFSEDSDEWGEKHMTITMLKEILDERVIKLRDIIAKRSEAKNERV